MPQIIKFYGGLIVKDKTKINYSVVISLNFLLIFIMSVICLSFLIKSADASQIDYTKQLKEHRIMDCFG